MKKTSWKNILFLLIIIGLFEACKKQSPNKARAKTNKEVTKKDSYTWSKILENANWKKSYNFQMFTINEKLWVFHPDGNWFSANGIDWTKSSLPNVVNNLAFLKYVVLNNEVYGLGHFEGNIEQNTFKPEIYKTTDFKEWQVLSKNSNLPKRFFYHPFAFENKMWIIGGEDKITQYADIWNSSDGINWTKQKDNLPFGKRSNSKIVILNGVLYLLNNDVWTSKNGLDWKLLTNEIVKGEEIFGYSVSVLDNKIWLLGCNRNGAFRSQVLVSSDGKAWQEQNAPWTPRGGVATSVFNGKIYLTGGKYGGTPDKPEFIYSNDLWSLGKAN